MAIYLIDKIQQKNDGTFFLVDAQDVEYNGKSIIDALKAGEIVQTGSTGATWHVANANIGSGNTGLDPKAVTPNDPKTGDIVVDANGDFYVVSAVAENGTYSVGENLKNADGSNLSFKGPKGDQGEQGQPGPQGEPGPAGTQGEQGPKGEQGVQGPKGDKGDAGKPFAIAKTYPSVDAMNKDFAGTDTSAGDFVIITTDDVNNEDNAKLFVKTDTQFTFVTDLSGAQGIQGPAGAKGDQGEQGPAGAAGAKGDPGQRGSRATFVTDTGTITDPLVGDYNIDPTTGALSVYTEA